MMELWINGEKKDIPEVANITEVMAALGLEPTMVLVEHNGLALRRSEWPNTKIQSGDQLEILRVAAGG